MRTSPLRLSRRHVIVAIIAGAGGVAAARWFNVGAREGDGMTVQAAHRAAVEGRITLIDIRRPEEWAATGVPQGAIPLDMRDPSFTNKLAALVTDKNAPVALICARGVRSGRFAAVLTGAGFANILDVPEGMLGSGAGPGWLAAGLPVTRL